MPIDQPTVDLEAYWTGVSRREPPRAPVCLLSFPMSIFRAGFRMREAGIVLRKLW